MSAALFALLAVLLAGLGARDQLLVGRMTTAQGARPLLLVVALAAAALAAAGVWWAARALLAGAPPPGRPLVALALVLAGFEALALRPRAAPAEPTASLFAAGTVLLASQVTDAARFLAVAIGVASAAPLPAALGAGLGGMGTVALGWLLPELADRREVGAARRIVGAVLLALGATVAVRALVF